MYVYHSPTKNFGASATAVWHSKNSYFDVTNNVKKCNVTSKKFDIAKNGMSKLFWHSKIKMSKKNCDIKRWECQSFCDIQRWECQKKIVKYFLTFK